VTNSNIVVKMTYYYINEQGLMQKQVGGQPPSDIFVGVSPDGMMRKYNNGVLESVVPVPDNPLKDILEQKTAANMLGYGAVAQRKHGRKAKPKSKRKVKRCRCK
jgi:hypothetical protein